jgi:hypothetical protein
MNEANILNHKEKTSDMCGKIKAKTMHYMAVGGLQNTRDLSQYVTRNNVFFTLE